MEGLWRLLHCEAMNSRWFHGLAATFIGGASGAISSGLALMVVVPEKFGLGPNLWLTIKTTAILGLITGAQTAFAYLKQAPLPEWDGGDRRSTEVKMTIVDKPAIAEG